MNKTQRYSRRSGGHSGFTLIELVVAVTIVAILSMIAYPSFMQSVRKSKRTDAQTALVRTLNNLERFFSTNGTYTTDVTKLGLMVDGGSAYSDDGHYIITVTAGPSGIANSYVVSATAKAGDPQADDTHCTSLSISSLGARTPDPVESHCW